MRGWSTFKQPRWDKNSRFSVRRSAAARAYFLHDCIIVVGGGPHKFVALWDNSLTQTEKISGIVELRFSSIAEPVISSLYIFNLPIFVQFNEITRKLIYHASVLCKDSRHSWPRFTNVGQFRVLARILERLQTPDLGKSMTVWYSRSCLVFCSAKQFSIRPNQMWIRQSRTPSLCYLGQRSQLPIRIARHAIGLIDS